MTINEFIYENSVERQIFLLRHRAGLSSRVKRALDIHDGEFSERLIVYMSRLSGRDLIRLGRAVSLDTQALKNLIGILNDFEKSSKEILSETITTELDQLTKDEYDFGKELIESAAEETSTVLPIILPITLTQARRYRKEELSVDKTEDEAISQWAARRKQKVLQQIRKTSSEGIQLEGILADVSGSKGILNATQFGAILATETLHATASTAGGVALVDINKDNEFDLSVIAILDGKTSSTCYQKHGKKVFKDLNGDRPPYHMRCRTGVYPCVGNSRPVSETVTKWFSRQTEQTKKSILGKTRYEAYSDDKSSLKFPRDFISSRGDLYTLEELSSRGKLRKS